MHSSNRLSGTHVSLPCMPPTTHAPCHTPLPPPTCMPPVCMSPAMNIPLPCMTPIPLPCAPPPCGQNDWHTLLKILPCPKLRLRAVKTGLVNMKQKWKTCKTDSFILQCKRNSMGIIKALIPISLGN